MGVPKFYRWISERYPCLSEVVKEYQIPEFDNLYLDMNGIIHVCSHPNDNDPHFRLSEEKMFKDIFHYIEVLFRLIQPKNLFFMAVDGVAPRAKMNQQRGRRFRSAREAVEAEKKARDRGEVLPKEERFDSNCITPGTEFMARLDTHLQYFVTYKVSQDKMWQNCKVIYSGHETPGEGEHKIMEYIRYTKSQPNYNPNTRHCLYGLDADLMMLGLTSHEPHFSLLREEVRFGGKKSSQSRTPTPEETTFHLLHLSLMREYISYEFADLKSTLPFPFDLEKVIDDWVLMGFLVGNDFIPHLPHFHINKEALPILYKAYKEVLPKLDGYLNDGGRLNLRRFEKFMEKLADIDVEMFNELNADLKYFNAKRSRGGRRKRNKGEAASMELEPFDFGDDDIEDDKAFDVLKTFEKLGIEPVSEMFEDDDDEEEEDESTSDGSTRKGTCNGNSTFDEEFRQHKRDYYMTKMHYADVDANVLHEQALCYVEGIQWILNYYYNGICSWSWYYPHHYAPYVSDIKGFSHISLEYDMGRPFMPYEQLLAVLPPLSKKLLPEAYQGLMTLDSSPLKEYYPETFETDLNGKQQDWEAVVLIPFIDEKKLLHAMAPCNRKLTEGQLRRNIHGPMYIYSYTSDNLGEYKAPEHFPSVGVNHAFVDLVRRERWEILPEKIFKGLCRDVKQELYFAGFPTLKHITHTFHVGKESVKVFQQNSRGDNFILDIKKPESNPDLKELADQILGKTVFVAWPHLIEAKVQEVSSLFEKYYLYKGKVCQQVLDGDKRDPFHLSKKSITTDYHDRWGINVGDIDILVYASAMTGRRYIASTTGRISLEKSWSGIIQAYAYQAIVRDITVYDPGFKEHLTPQEYFPPRTKLFMLGQPHYGCMGEVIEIDPSHKGRIRVVMTVLQEPNFDVVVRKQEELRTKYMSGYQIAQKVGISSHLLARLTGTIFLVPPSSENPNELEMRKKLNIGLNLKNNKSNEEVVGYTQKIQDDTGRTTWLYSQKTVDALKEYQMKFPEIFEYLSLHVGEKDIFFQDEVFGQENYKEHVAGLTKWLKESDFAMAPRQACYTPYLDDMIVARIAEEVDKVSAVCAKPIKMQVRPHLLFKPNALQGSTPPDPQVTFFLFDRVTNCREGFSVPLGARGTIIGIHPASKEADIMYDILFDEPFEEGLTFGGPMTEKRCYRLHSASIINISHGSRLNSVISGDDITRPEQPNHTAWDNHRQDHNQQYQNHHQNRQQYSRPHNTDRQQGYYQQLGQQPLMPYQSPQGNGDKDQGFDYKPQRITQRYDPANPQPPDPNQLPSPAGLYEGTVEIHSAQEVECIVYGTYYAAWSKINQQGIVKHPGRTGFLCFSCVPKVKPGPKAFQLLIFINLEKALHDGIRFHRINDRHVLCTGDRQGFLRPEYFIKVVDCENNKIIYPHLPGNSFEAASPHSGRQVQGISVADQMMQPSQGKGRGSLLQQPQGMQLYENIWSQLQREESIRGPNTQLSQSQILLNSLNVPEKKAAQAHASGRTEVSVEDIFRGARACSNQTLEQPPRMQGNADILSLLTSAHHSHQMQQNRNQETRVVKEESPVKSAFVPTQVIRKQTPRKPKASQSKDTTKHSPVTGEVAEASIDGAEKPHMQQQPYRQCQNQPNANSSKKPRRNRLAVNLPFKEDT